MMRRRSIFLLIAVLLCGLCMLRLFSLPRPVVAFNPDNLLMQQQTAGRPPGGMTPE